MTQDATMQYDNSSALDPRIAARLKRDGKGLVAAVIQQYDTREVLMVGYMNDEALRRTLTTQRRHLRSCAVREIRVVGLRRRRAAG